MSDPLPFDSATPRFAFPMLYAGQAQKEVFVNEALLRADLLVHCTIEAEVQSPPAAPAPGQAWLVAPAPAGAFTGHAGNIAGWTQSGWRFVAPRDGLRVFDRSATVFRTYVLDSWRQPARVSLPTGGSVVDTQVRSVLQQLIEQLTSAGILATS